MNHKGTVLLETDRLILRKFRFDDVQLAYQNWTSDDAVTEYLSWPTHTSEADTKQILDYWISSYEQLYFYQWAIVLKETLEPIGAISVVGVKEAVASVSIGYCIGAKWWHQGLTSEAFSAVIKFLMDEVGVNRIEARHDVNNPNSGKVMVKCGLQYEGTLRQCTLSNKDTLVDVSVYSLLRDEYNKNLTD